MEWSLVKPRSVCVLFIHPVILQLIATVIGTGGVVMVAQPWVKDDGKHDYDCPIWVDYDTQAKNTKMLLGYGLAVLAGTSVWH